MSEFPQDLSWKNVTDLAGKTVVITGIASGISRATAIQFARAGARVLGGDINVEGGRATARDIVGEGGKAEFFPLDLSQGDSVDAFTKAVLEASGGKIDVIANVAGWEKVEPFLDNTPELWDRIIAINYLGPVRMIHRLLPAMIERRAGKIITVASDAGRVGSLGETFYSGSKGAIIAFTKGLAREMARYNINCNVVCPGPTDTPLFATLGEKLRMALEKAIPFRRLGQPMEVAHSIVYLATPAAGFITGQVLSVSGGLTMHG